jgi:BirA family biotin operon repressor/biotin-[acetyl-CoA-carboxylase] ligase
MNAAELTARLEPLGVAVQAYDSIESTNRELIRQARDGAKSLTLLAAARQTSGYGSRGREFYSPDSGAYFSLLVREAADFGVTARAAVAAADAIAETFALSCGIKWPNDLIIGGKKVGGILVEAFPGFYVLGIGLNVFRTEYPGLPNAGSIAGSPIDGVRERLVADVVTRFLSSTHEFTVRRFRELSVLIGRDVIAAFGGQRVQVRVEGIDDEFRLIVRFSDGITKTLTSGEITFNHEA